MVAVPPRLNPVCSCTALFRALAISACVLMLPAAAQAQGLKFFKNYFHTGGHYAQGVSLRGTGTDGFAEATITIAPDANGVTGLPPNADVLVALLYWETVTTASGNGTAGAEFNGHSISAGAKFLNPSGTPPCWSNGGATGGGSTAHQMKAYRADVAPFIPHDAATGKRKYIGTHTIRLPDVGVGNVVPSTAGATLLFIYSIPGNQTLRSTVIYDGGVTVNQTNPTHALTLSGWYQASKSNPDAYVTQVVGNGQTNFGEVTTFNGGAAIDTFTNPFTGQSGSLPTQPGVWDTFTTAVTLNAGAASATVTTSRASGNGSFDCLTWGAIMLTTNVQDNEKDNIVDILEESSTAIIDPNTGERVPDLYAMGARTWNKDIFIEIGFMRSKAGYGPNALGQTIPANHTHLPDLEALNMVAKAFNAQKINLHFDVGAANYQKAWTASAWTDCFKEKNASWTADCAIIPAIVPGTGTEDAPAISLADGGEYIEETLCSPSTTTSCLFPDYPGPVQCGGTPQLNFACRFTGVPGTVVWKSGFRYYRDEPLTHRKTKAVGTFMVDDGPNEAGCITAETDGNAGTVCKRRFARNRHDWFRYSLWVHATGIPRDSPNQATPRNVSGIGDFLGADHQVSLGLWDYATGTTFVQASTFMHELGHGLGLRHGGIVGEPNCKPNYQSVMNYLFQVRGLINDLGIAEIGYSNQVLKALEEDNLDESVGLKTTDNQTMQWRTRWYTAWSDSFIDNAGGLNVTPVSKRCNGAPKANEVMARVDGSSTTGAIDWNANGMITGSIPPVTSDLNFSGSPLADLAPGANDWLNLNLQTIGSRRNVGGWSAESGYWDTGYWDTGAQTGTDQAGYWDTGYWDTGAPGDLVFQSGYWDTGYWDTGYWDTGYWDTGAESDSALVPKGEMDLDTASSIGNAPNAVKAQVPPKQQDPVVSWLPPYVGADKVASYEVYRVEGTSITPANFQNRVTINNNVVPPIGATDDTVLSVTDTTAKNNVWYIYIVLAEFHQVGTNPAVRSGIAQSQPFRK